jgi:hypothetical protein
MVVNWKKEEEKNLLQLWHQRPFCRIMSQEELRLEEQI